MDVLYGVHYRPGAWPLLIMCLGLMSDAVIGAAAPILIFSGNQKLAGSISTGALVSAIALNYTLVPRFGLIGGAISTALAEGGMLCGLLLAARSRVGIWPYDRRWIKRTKRSGVRCRRTSCSEAMAWRIGGAGPNTEPDCSRWCLLGSTAPNGSRSRR